MLIRCLTVIFVLAVLPVNELQPQATSGLAVEVDWLPRVPLEGSVITVQVRQTNLSEISGELAGESLHFELVSSGAFWAVGGIPLDGQDPYPLVITLTRGDRTDSIILSVPVGPGNFGVDTLAVASRFGEEPDSVLQERIDRESAQADSVGLMAHRTPRLWTDTFIVPRVDRISSGFGRARVFNGEVRSRHYGVDIDGEPGDSVLASNSGVVALIGNFYYAGNVVYVNHGSGLATVYMHLSEVLVQEGDAVMRGQAVGRIGETGRVTGPHLHWTAKYGGTSVNALSLLELVPFSIESTLVTD